MVSTICTGLRRAAASQVWSGTRIQAQKRFASRRRPDVDEVNSVFGAFVSSRERPQRETRSL